MMVTVCYNKSWCVGEAKDVVTELGRTIDKYEAYKVARSRLDLRFGD